MSVRTQVGTNIWKDIQNFLSPILQPTPTKVTVAVSQSGTDRVAAYWSGDHSGAPFLTLQSALASLPTNSSARRIVVIGADVSFYAGALVEGFQGSGEVVLKFGTAAPTLVGPTSGAAGAGSTTTTCNLPTGSGTNWASDTLRGLFIEVVNPNDADIPYIRPIKSKTNTSFTFDAIPGFTAGTAFAIKRCATTLNAAAATFQGGNVALAVANNGAPVISLYCRPNISVDYGISSTNNARSEHHGFVGGAANFYNFQSRNDLYAVLNDSYLSSGGSSQLNSNTFELQNCISDGGTALIQGVNTALIQLDSKSVTTGVPLTVKRCNNVQVGFAANGCTASSMALFDSCTSLTQQNGGLTGGTNTGYGIDFQNGGQYNVTGASLTGSSGDFSIDGSTSSLQTWAQLATSKAMSRYGAGTLLLAGSTAAEVLVLESIRIAGTNFDIDGAQEQHGGRVINYGFVHFATAKFGGGSAQGMTAFGGGGQGSATLCGLGLSVFTNVANDHDSAILNSAVIGGLWQIVANFSSKILDIYPPVNGHLNGGSQNAPYSVPAGRIAVAMSQDTGTGLDYVIFSVLP